jgi:hypothetical protein
LKIKVEELHQSVKDNGKGQEDMNGTYKTSWIPSTDQIYETVIIEEGEELQTKSIKNLLNTIKAENFPSLG